MKQIFPKEILDNTVEVFYYKHSTTSKWIYLVILLALIGVFISLPFISINVYTSARGIIKPNKERIVLNSLHQGKVIFNNVYNNRNVKKGDTLLIIENNQIEEQLKLKSLEIKEVENFISDIKHLLSNNKRKYQNLISDKYRYENLTYRKQVDELSNRYKKAKNDFERTEILYNKSVLAKEEFENSEFEYQFAKDNLVKFKQEKGNDWQGQSSNYKNELVKLESNKSQLLLEKNLYTLIAPVSGTLKNAIGIEIGSVITLTSKIAEISQNTDLIVECYIEPKDIGLLREELLVNYQLDAYNYNQWGLGMGKIDQIHNDVDIMNNKPVFKIQCSVDQNYLTLKNGFKGALKKGMTLTARFKIAERSLYDLLYDKMDDWLNPNSPSLALK